MSLLSQLATGLPRSPELDQALTIAVALREAQLELGEDVLVIGDGEAARLAAELAEAAGAFVVRLPGIATTAQPSLRRADVVIYAGNEPSQLGPALGGVRDRGRFLLLATLADVPVDFDTYPDLHKRSIQLIGAGESREPSDQLVSFVQHLVVSGRLQMGA